MKNNRPLISVIVPVYNVEEYIVDTLDSIANQSFKDFELILVNDGSKDSSIEKAEAFLLSSDMSYRIINQSNKGVAIARNNGVVAAKGEWIICLDADDTISPVTFEILAELVNDEANQGIHVIAFNYQYVSTPNKFKFFTPDKVKSQILFREEISNAFLTRKIKLLSPALLVEQELAKRTKYEPEARFCEDLLYIWEILSEEEKILWVDEKLYNYLIRSKSTMTSSSSKKMITGYEAFVNLDQRIKQKELFICENQEYILPRWVLGAINTAAKNMTLQNFLDFSKQVDAQKNLKKLRDFPDIKVKMLSIFYRMNPNAYYSLLRRIARKNQL